MAPGTNEQTNPNAMRALLAICIFTDCALIDDDNVCWKGLDLARIAHRDAEYWGDVAKQIEGSLEEA